MASFRPTFHSTLASEFVSNVYYGRKTLHYFLGKVDSWEPYKGFAQLDLCDCSCQGCVGNQAEPVEKEFGDTTNPHNDPNNAYVNETIIRDNILYVKKIAPDDVSVVIPRHKWTSGTIYSQWDDRQDMTEIESDRPFYVVNSEFNVYKCLSNNKRWVGFDQITGESVYEIEPSIYEPTGISYDVVKTPDHYVWKYMYSIPLVKQNKFVSSRYIPVQRAVDENFYAQGGIEEVIVLNQGSGYSSNPITTATVDVPEDGRQAKISLLIDSDTGSIQSVYIVDRGSGYIDTAPPKIKVVDQLGRGQGKYEGHNEAMLSANILNGELDSVSIDDCGINYTPDIETLLSVTGDGEGCKLYPLIVDGRIVDVVVGEPGFGYTNASVSAQCARNSANIEKAAFKVKLGGSKLDDDQSVVEQTAVPGAIYSIVVTDGGSEYNSLYTTVEVIGDGTGCTAHAEFNGGQISRVVVDSYGQGYTTAEVVFKDASDPLRDQVGTKKKAKCYAVMPPFRGHGYNAVEELYGRTVSVSSSIKDDNDLGKIDQDFRQYGLIAQLRNVSDNTLNKDSEGIVLFDVEFDPVGIVDEQLKPDSVVTINDINYRVAFIEGYNIKLQQMSYIFKNITTDDVIKFINPLNGVESLYNIEKINSIPSVDKYSGEMYYINNNLPFKMQSGRSFNLRTQIVL